MKKRIWLASVAATVIFSTVLTGCQPSPKAQAQKEAEQVLEEIAQIFQEEEDASDGAHVPPALQEANSSDTSSVEELQEDSGSEDQSQAAILQQAGRDPQKNYASVEKYGDGLFSAYGKGSASVAYGTDGSILFSLEDGDQFAYEDDNLYHWDYALTKNGSIVDRSGRVVYSPEAYGYTGIVSDACLDVGYILCSQDVNTFDDTSTHIYAVNLADGSTFELTDPEKEPAVEKLGNGWYYFGDGYFVCAPPHSGFDTTHLIYNILTGETRMGYIMNEDGSRNEENLPDLHFKLREDVVYYDNHKIYYSHDGVVRCEDLDTGEIKNMTFPDGQTVYSSGDHMLKNGYFAARRDDSYGVPYDILFDAVTGEEIPMNEYAGFEIYSYLPDGGLLAKVTNEGGGVFVTVINRDGSRRFEPIVLPKERIGAWGGSGFSIALEDGTYEIYDYNGNRLGLADNQSVTFGDTTVLYEERDESRDNFRAYVLLNTETGSSMKIPGEILSGMDSCLAYANGGYLCSSVLPGSVFLKEDGTFVSFEEIPYSD